MDDAGIGQGPSDTGPEKPVKRNKGAGGADGMTVDALADDLKQHWPDIKAPRLDGSDRPPLV